MKAVLRKAALAASICGSMIAMPVSACLWEYATGVDGKPKVVSGIFPEGPIRSRPSEGWDGKLSRLAAEPDFAANHEKRNDYAVALIHLNRATEAIPLLEEIESKTPGVYVTAVNLGTAYELAGKDDLALKWITEGIRRNANSHQGTEWLHGRILEAKIALKSDPKWLETHSVFDGGVSLTGDAAAPKGPRPFKDGSDLPRDANATIEALRYQLGERMQFVKPPEAVVGELLLEYASLVALTKSVEQANALLKLASEYKPARVALLSARQAHFQSLVSANPKSGKRASGGSQYDEYLEMTMYAFFAIVMLVAAFYVGRAVVRRRKSGPGARAA